MRYYEKIIDAEWEELPPAAAVRSDARCTFRYSLYVQMLVLIAGSILIGRILGFFIYGR